MSKHDINLQTLIANGSETFRKLNPNLENNNTSPSRGMERNLVNGVTRPNEIQKKSKDRFLIMYRVFRMRLLDKENLGGTKYWTDQIVRHGIIPDDKYEMCDIQWQQEKVKTEQEERIEIEVFLL